MDELFKRLIKIDRNDSSISFFNEILFFKDLIILIKIIQRKKFYEAFKNNQINFRKIKKIIQVEYLATTNTL